MTQHDFDLIRDLHKAARGRRPSCDWDEWFAALPTAEKQAVWDDLVACLLYTSPSPRDQRGSRMPSSA